MDDVWLSSNGRLVSLRTGPVTALARIGQYVSAVFGAHFIL
jgi:hypothetical protein